MNGPKFNDWYEKRYTEWRERQMHLNDENRERIDALIEQVVQLKAELEKLRGEIV